MKTVPGEVTKLSPRLSSSQKLSNDWEQPSPTFIRDSAINVAQLTKDFDLMLQETNSREPSVMEKKSAARRHKCMSDNRDSTLEVICFVSSLITVIGLCLLSVVCFLFNLPGIGILPLIGSLVFLYLTILQKKSFSISIATGCIIGACCVILFCGSLLAVWALNWKIILNHDEYIDVSDGGLTRKGEAVSLPWGCLRLNNKTDGSLSIPCIAGHTLLGIFSLMSALSALSVLVFSSSRLAQLLNKKTRRRSETISPIY